MVEDLQDEEGFEGDDCNIFVQDIFVRTYCRCSTALSPIKPGLEPEPGLSLTRALYQGWAHVLSKPKP
jgi:hypothetical protein